MNDIKDAFEWAWLDGRSGTDEGHEWLHENRPEAWHTYCEVATAEAMKNEGYVNKGGNWVRL